MAVYLWGLYSSSIYRREREEQASLGFPLGVGRTRARRSPIHFLLGSGFILGRSPIPSYLHLFSSWAYGPLWGRFPSPLGAGAPPLRSMWPPVVGGTHPVDPRNPFVTPGTLPEMPKTFPEFKHHFPIYKSLPPDHSGAPRDVRDLIRDSEQPSVTNTYISILPKRHRTLSVQTLRVRELCRHDRDTSTVNNQ